jgi:hypothetical protein
MTSLHLARKIVRLLPYFSIRNFSSTPKYIQVLPLFTLQIIYSQRFPEAAGRIKFIAHRIFPSSYCLYAESAVTTISTGDHSQKQGYS